jgi:hypothetical protein
VATPILVAVSRGRSYRLSRDLRDRLVPAAPYDSLAFSELRTQRDTIALK